MSTEKEMSQKALHYVRKNKQNITEIFLKDYKSVNYPISIFMAGAPGSGKTEWARGLAEVLEGNILHIDGDQFRSILPEYTGNNSHIFQKSISKLVSYIHDKVLDKNISFILDGTFSDTHRAEENILRSLKRKRKVIITYIYLKPECAWQYTQDREKEEGRRILKETFIQKYIGAYDTVRYIRNRFSSEEVEILLVNKINMISNDNIDIINIISADQLDERLEKVYNKDELENLL